MKREPLVWREKYRPGTISECILPDRLKTTFQTYVDKKEIPDLLLYGAPGMGKTTVAKALCKQVGCDYIVIPGSEDNGIDVLRTTIRSYASTISLSGGRKVVIIDEADYLNANSLQPALRTALEEFTKNCSFIFTCNNQNRIIPALRSRFAEVEFKLLAKEKAEMAKQLLAALEIILCQEGIAYKKNIVIEVIKKYFPNYRKVITELQKYSVTGSIDEGLLTQIVDVDIKELMGYLKNKDFTNVKKWTVKNSPGPIYENLCENIQKFLKDSSIPALILILSKYQYQHSMCADGELQLLACFVEIMLEMEWKD